MFSRTAIAVAAAASLAGCAAGPASVQTEAVSENGLVRFEFATEGKNSFTVAGASCDAPRGGTCVVEISMADLQAGWNEIPIETRRRTGEEEKLTARVFVGEDAFRRTCEVRQSGGPDPRTLQYEIKCEFEDGFAGELFGEAMPGGLAIVKAAEVRVDENPANAGVLRPLVVGDLPIVVTNRAGGRWERPLKVVVPLPLVQLSVTGWQDPWYEDVLPLRIRAEAGAEILVDGEPVRPKRDGASFVREVKIKPGPNRIRVEARLPDRVDAVVDLSIRGKAPDTPLYIDEPAVAELTTSDHFVRIRGRTIPEARVYLANRPADIARDGSFEFVVPLDEGDNEIEVLAVVDPGPRIQARPATKRSFAVRVEGDDEQRIEQRQYAASDLEAANAEVLADLGRDPWGHVGAKVTFPMVLRDMATSLVKGGCEARIEGDACTHEVSQEVRVGFETREAKACDGEELPAVIELDSCPDVAEGQRVIVVGKVLGGLGGRVGQFTVERPRIRASELRDAPWIVEARR